MNGELFEKSNIESVLCRLQDIATPIKIKTQYKNDDELIASIAVLAKENDISVNENMQKEEKRPESVMPFQDKEVKQRVVLSTKKVYKIFIKQDKDLATFLKQKDLDKKQFLSILIRITLQYNKFLTISKDEIIEHKGIKIPYIIKRG